MGLHIFVNINFDITYNIHKYMGVNRWWLYKLLMWDKFQKGMQWVRAKRVRQRYQAHDLLTSTQQPQINLTGICMKFSSMLKMWKFAPKKEGRNV